MATYPTHGVHLRQRHPNRWLLLVIVVVAALVGVGAWALVDHYTGGTTKPATGSATLTSTRVANTYIAAIDKLQPYALAPILAKNVVEIDWAYGSSPFQSAKTLERNWASVIAASGDAHVRASLRAAAPDWAAVTTQLRGSTNPLTYEPFTMNGLSILNIKQGKIVRETLYYDVPGRNPGIAGVIGGTFATALSGHHSGWARTVRSLYSNDAIESYVGTAPSAPNVNNLVWGGWTNPNLEPLHASLCCAGPSFRLDNGKTRNSWAVVDWTAKSNPDGYKVSGVSVFEIRNAKIIRETMYY